MRADVKSVSDNTLQVASVSQHQTSKTNANIKMLNYPKLKEDHIFLKLNAAEKALEKDDLEQALIEFNKVLFFEKTIPDVYVEKAEIYIKLCDFSSAIQCFKKALGLPGSSAESTQEWRIKMN